ncbi:PDE1C [Cordylochernes scorpioides]|uniref:Phosphodiesterase n=1 Tax=Cordylochernes scorpioides TaxID=51811 RepID=A0ABY6K0Q5_9ARAC|nr:PDE1C [Cordylochernes scorpioides]
MSSIDNTMPKPFFTPQEKGREATKLSLTLGGRRLLPEDEDELSEVQPDAVPTEVREWLASTFTRQSASRGRRSEDKPKFRSVANAIRAGIMVDRIYRRMCSATVLYIPSPVAPLLKEERKTCNKLVINVKKATGRPRDELRVTNRLNRRIFVHSVIKKTHVTEAGRLDIRRVCRQSDSRRPGPALHAVRTTHAVRARAQVQGKRQRDVKQERDARAQISSATLENLMIQIEAGYAKYRNPYHNDMHAADVTQTVHFLLHQLGMSNWLTDLEIFATLLAAVVHDFEHTGTTNNFHVMSGSETALLYNDRAVLENHHVSTAFRLLRSEDCNILHNLSREEYRELHRLARKVVMAVYNTSTYILCPGYLEEFSYALLLDRCDVRREFRSLVIEMVLATDMSSHFQQIKTMKALLTHSEFTTSK